MGKERDYTSVTPLRGRGERMEIVPYCVGCKKSVDQLKEYDDENPVEDDGTFANGKFVCTGCYVRLIPMGLDVGSPEIIQRRIQDLAASK